MNENKNTRSESTRELVYGKGCPLEWPFNEDTEVSIISILKYSHMYSTIESLLEKEERKIFMWITYEEDREFVGYDYNIKEELEFNTENEKQRNLLMSLISGWCLKDFVISSIFYHLSCDIQRDGCISPWSWHYIVPYIVSPLIGSELLAVINRNNFLDVNPDKVVEGVRMHFLYDSYIYKITDHKGYIANIPKLLLFIKIDSKVVQSLMEKVVKDGSVNCITIFLHNYIFPKTI